MSALPGACLRNPIFVVAAEVTRLKLSGSRGFVLVTGASSPRLLRFFRYALRNPNQLCIICSPALGREIPVIDIPEPPGVAVQKSKLCPATVQVRVDIVLLSDTGQPAVVKQPNRG